MLEILFFEEKSRKSLEINKKVVPLQPQKRNKLYFSNAQMAESVDALVSNTSGFTSIPVRPRVWVQKRRKFLTFSFFYTSKQGSFKQNHYICITP